MSRYGAFRVQYILLICCIGYSFLCRNSVWDQLGEGGIFGDVIRDRKLHRHLRLCSGLFPLQDINVCLVRRLAPCAIDPLSPSGICPLAFVTHRKRSMIGIQKQGTSVRSYIKMC